MTEIILPFKPEFKDRMLSGKKTCTSRTRKYGDTGDTFEVFNTKFEITLVYNYKLDCVAYLLCHDEGFESPEDFMKAWAEIHPWKGYVPSQSVWVHEFKKVKL